MTRCHMLGCAWLVIGGALVPQASAAGDSDDYREVQGGNNLGLRLRPDNEADFVTSGLRNGDRVRVLGGEKHQGHRWCRVEFEGYIGWIGQARLRPP